MVNVELMLSPFRSALALAVYEAHWFHEGTVRPNFRLRPTEKAKSNSL